MEVGGVTLYLDQVYISGFKSPPLVDSCAELCWSGLTNDNGNKIMTGEMMNMTSDTNHNIIIQSLSSLNIF